MLGSLAEGMNRQHARFRLRHPDFAGPVSVMAHSLGSVLTYDVLCNQEPPLGRGPGPGPAGGPSAPAPSAAPAPPRAEASSAAAAGGDAGPSEPGSGSEAVDEGEGAGQAEPHAAPSLVALSSADLGLGANPSPPPTLDHDLRGGGNGARPAAAPPAAPSAPAPEAAAASRGGAAPGGINGDLTDLSCMLSPGGASAASPPDTGPEARSLTRSAKHMCTSLLAGLGVLSLRRLFCGDGHCSACARAHATRDTHHAPRARRCAGWKRRSCGCERSSRARAPPREAVRAQARAKAGQGRRQGRGRAGSARRPRRSRQRWRRPCPCRSSTLRSTSSSAWVRAARGRLTLRALWRSSATRGQAGTGRPVSPMSPAARLPAAGAVTQPGNPSRAAPGGPCPAARGRTQASGMQRVRDGAAAGRRFGAPSCRAPAHAGAPPPSGSERRAAQARRSACFWRCGTWTRGPGAAWARPARPA